MSQFGFSRVPTLRSKVGSSVAKCRPDQLLEVFVGSIAHRSTVLRSERSARADNDLTVPGRHPSEAAISASDKSS
jgi:hypothetical protein